MTEENMRDPSWPLPAEEAKQAEPRFAIMIENVDRFKAAHLKSGPQGERPFAVLGAGGKLGFSAEKLRTHWHDLQCFVDGKRGQDRLLRIVVHDLSTGAEQGAIDFTPAPDRQSPTAQLKVMLDNGMIA